ncbi:MAG: aminotransferase class I/II-fold pyridoxal phosphate-dependent enzyme [Candidatus Gracilibacteria bacterium]|nr:aminotransferase class I/II-fold pyridoxal phosphate-dependent enzyme [Candidatus Gracilibacteria bacterium]
MKKTIITDFFTTLSRKHFFKSLSFLTIRILSIRTGKYNLKLEKKILDYLNLRESKIISFYNARSALYHCFKLIGIKKDDEIVINSYNCISVVNSVIQSGAIPIYAEIDKKNLSFDTELLESKITENTKAIVIQHTFGKSAQIKKIKEIVSKYNLVVIEDCSHSLGSKYDDLKHGSFFDFAIYSTGRDKVISGVNGGFLVINNTEYFKNISKIKKNLILPPKKLVLKNLAYNILGSISLKTYDFFGLGKAIIHISRKSGLINEILDENEKECNNSDLNYLLPNSLAAIALYDIHRIFFYQRDREEISNFYDANLESTYFKPLFKELVIETLNYFRYPILFKSVEIKNDFYNYMRKNKVILGHTWSDSNIVPKGTSNEITMYKGDCEVAEDIASKILFLPNNKNVTKKDLKRIMDLIEEYEFLNIENSSLAE